MRHNGSSVSDACLAGVGMDLRLMEAWSFYRGDVGEDVTMLAATGAR